MTKRLAFVVSAVAVGLLAGPSASAAVITRTYDLKAGSFVSASGTGVSPVSGLASQFMVTYDDAVDLEATSLGSSLGLPGTYGQNIKFAYSARYGGLTIGQNPFPAGLVYETGGIGFAITDITSATPRVSSFLLTTSSRAQFRPLDVTIAAVAPTIPEPATWGLMLAGFGMIAGVSRFRRRRGGVAFA